MKSRAIIQDLKQIDIEIDNIRQQSARCEDHPTADIDVQFAAIRSWRGWVCRCLECGEVIDEFDECPVRLRAMYGIPDES